MALGFAMNLPVNGGMKVPQVGGPLGQLGNAGSMSSWATGFQQATAQREVDQVAMQDAYLPGGVQNGSLNRDEFVNLSAQQNEMARLSGQFAADGVVTPDEQARLNSLRCNFQEDLANFSNGDFHPGNKEGQKGIAGTQDRQSGFLFDATRSGKITPQQAMNLRQQMSGAAFSQGNEAGWGYSGDTQIADTQSRLATVWNQLGNSARNGQASAFNSYW